jgi:NAD(P)-dependent dehydrogenase (short-subunit alcohol dehydrogenase family)
MNDLAGRHAFITGGGAGIGLAAAEALAARGAKLTLAARNFARLEDAASKLGANPVAVDVTNETSVNAAFEAARAAHGPVHILINNAGVAPSAPLHRTDLKLWSDTLAVNVTGAFLCARGALPDMLDAGWGRIVNVGSVCSLKGYAYVTAYCASKHALLGFTRALAQETARKGVTVNAVCPGYVETDIVTNAVRNIVGKTKLTEAEAYESLYRFNPQGRLIEPREVASAIAWLCSQDAAATNGAAIPITGGEA